jgi:glycosyltransferase involved in cell wall biosynthesis
MLMPHTRLVLGFHGLESGGDFSRRDRCAARIAKALGARFTSVSELGKCQMAHQLRVPLQHIEQLANGIDSSRFAAHTAQTRPLIREALGYLPHDRVIGIVGSLTAVKGHDLLLSAVAAVAQTIPDLRLLVVGDGPLRGALVAATRKLTIHDRVHFTGWREDVPALLSAMDGYVCASRSEGMSNAVMEAMASGLPVVSTSVGDHPTVLRHGLDGLLVPPGDASALAQSLQTLLNSPDRAVGTGRSAQTRIKEFSFGSAVDAYQRYYHSMLSQPAAQTHAFACICRGVSKSVFRTLTPRVAPRLSLK